MWLLASLLVPSSAHAQVTIDVAKITCEQFFTMRGDPDAIGIWLGGYYHAKQNNTVVDLNEFKENVKNIRVACRLPENAKLPIMQVIEKSMASQK
jgi:hypothetical protein